MGLQYVRKEYLLKLLCDIIQSYKGGTLFILAVQVQPKMVSVGTQTERFEKQTSTPLSSPVHSDDESSSVVMDEAGDISWIAEEEMTSDSSDEELANPPLQESEPDLK